MKVERIPPAPPEDMIVLTCTMDEALMLRALLGATAGGAGERNLYDTLFYATANESSRYNVNRTVTLTKRE